MSLTQRLSISVLVSLAFLTGACAASSSGGSSAPDPVQSVQLSVDDDVQAQIDDLTTQVHDLSSRVDDLESTVEDLGGNLGPSTERNVTTLDERVSALETR